MPYELSHLNALWDALGKTTVRDEDVYAEALYQVNSYAKKFFKGSQKDVVEIAGNSDFSLDKDYSQEKYQTVYELLKQS